MSIKKRLNQRAIATAMRPYGRSIVFVYIRDICGAASRLFSVHMLSNGCCLLVVQNWVTLSDIGHFVSYIIFRPYVNKLTEVGSRMFDRLR